MNLTDYIVFLKRKRKVTRERNQIVDCFSFRDADETFIGAYYNQVVTPTVCKEKRKTIFFFFH